MSSDLRFCCEAVKKMFSGYDAPLYCLSDITECGFFEYGFADRQIMYCPMCGKQLSKPTFIIPKADTVEFCCGTMGSNANVPDEHAGFEIFYQPWVRRYFFSTATGEWRLCHPKGTVFQEWDFYYCLYCGKKLPESLLETWLKIVKKDFGVDKQEPIEKMLPKLPEEFRTDLWWKNRGL